MAYSVPLLGPPAAGNVATHPSEPLPKDTAMDTIVSETADLSLDGNPPMGRTENFSATFISSGDPCLDFFFHVVPDTPADQLIQRLTVAWAHDPLTTLKLICNLRGVRGTGKSDKEGFYTAGLWLHDRHPKTLALNVRAIADFGYLKDLPEILYRLVQGSDIRKIEKEEVMNRKKLKVSRKKFKRKGSRKWEFSEKEKEVLLENVKELGNDKETARNLRKEKEIAKAVKALERYKNDSSYRFLFDSISDVFAELLKFDMVCLNSGELFKISLAAKWCPSIDSSYDRATLLYEAIARRVFPREDSLEYEGIEEGHYVYRIRNRLRKEVLVPLHKVLQLPEVYMSANEWNSLPYNRVASVAMKNYKGLFSKHDSHRFTEYLENVKSGKAKLAAGALLPHEIIASLNDEDGGKVAELQWARMVEDLAKKGKLTNCIAVCDVSGSMHRTPMEVAVAIGLLVSELSDDPWKGKVITFSENPEMHLIKGDSLLSKTQFVREMDWGYNTDFQKVFDRILDVAVESKLSEDQMIKRVFVFSDMEFDEATGNYSNYYCQSDVNSEYDLELETSENVEEAHATREEELNDESSETDFAVIQRKKKEFVVQAWETDYAVIQRKFQEKGYSKVPEIVFWNLRNSSSTPVAANQTGVALVSGFSKNILTLFLEGGIVTPEDVMKLAISGNEYNKLAVYD